MGHFDPRATGGLNNKMYPFLDLIFLKIKIVNKSTFEFSIYDVIYITKRRLIESKSSFYSSKVGFLGKM